MRAVTVLSFLFSVLSAVQGSAAFPQSWKGVWRGDIGGDATMQLTITPLDSHRWNWKIKYSGEPERPYELRVLDAQKGHFVVDERNGIIIDHFYQQETLTAAFAVNGNWIVFTYEMTPAGISVHSPSFRLAAPRQSGPEAPVPVCSFFLNGNQRGLLRKIQEG